MNTTFEIETLLREKQVAFRQANRNIPQYICYWADESVTTSDSISEVTSAAKSPIVAEQHQRLLAYLSPIGQFVVTDGGWVGKQGTGCPICGNFSMVFDENKADGSYFCWISACCTLKAEEVGSVHHQLRCSI